MIAAPSAAARVTSACGMRRKSLASCSSLMRLLASVTSPRARYSSWSAASCSSTAAHVRRYMACSWASNSSSEDDGCVSSLEQAPPSPHPNPAARIEPAAPSHAPIGAQISVAPSAPAPSRSTGWAAPSATGRLSTWYSLPTRTLRMPSSIGLSEGLLTGVDIRTA
eukprot:scaffold320284_cov30-Tisochrysis_lutea.AAC.2